MTVRYRTPGVYFETIDPAARQITEVRSDIAGFVGVAERGPLHCAVKIESWTQFRTRFGERTPNGLLAYAVYGFFANGGRTCWVVRVGRLPVAPRRAALLFVNRAGRDVLRIEARDDGPGAESIRVRMEPTAGGRFTLLVRIKDATVETWKDLSMSADDPRSRYALDVVNAGSDRTGGADGPAPAVEDSSSLRGSVLIRALDVSDGTWDKAPAGVKPPQRFRSPVPNREGALGQEELATGVLAGLTLDDFTGENQPPGIFRGLACLSVVEEVSLAAIPDLMWPGPPLPPEPKPPTPRCQVLQSTPAVPRRSPADPRPELADSDRFEGQCALLRHCASLRDRFGLLDAPWGYAPDMVIQWADRLRCEMGQYVGLYYPWIYVPDPLDLDGELRPVPPSGHVAGMAARVDLSAGVQKSPANERLEDARAAAVDVDAPTHGELNDASVNVIRAYPGRGVRVAGARTLTDNDHPEWQFVNVRRLLLMIEQSIDRASQWTTFEPNNPDRWRELDRVVRNFLDDEWRAGRLDGPTAAQAYSVTCDATTNPPEETDRGKMICMIGVQPPLPAEFVVVRLGRTADQTGSGGEGRDAGA